ncbi:MAG: 2'-5' RNA ligase family protein [Alphaproteobacteria bacterium]|nr:2'-5' RNA ligase family protein [Alphaproteobacteria bacterium]
MGFCLNLRISPASAPAVTALWDDVAALEPQPSMRPLGYPPHLTLAIYDSDIVGDDQRMRALDGAAVGQTELRLSFNRIGLFTGPSLVVWADPDPKAALRRMHQAIHSVIEPALCRPHYRPGAWVPHCTLGMAIPAERRDAAMDFGRNFRGGLEATFDVIDCVTFPPLRITIERRLLPAP